MPELLIEKSEMENRNKNKKIKLIFQLDFLFTNY